MALESGSMNVFQLLITAIAAVALLFVVASMSCFTFKNFSKINESVNI
jgi:TolB-like protein